MTSKRINIWSSPRNVSTAFMYSFAQRKDTTVVDEPLYAHFLRETNTEATHPGTAEILATMEQSGVRVVDQMMHADYTREVVIFKQMTHHLIALDRAFLADMDNVLLIRDPRRIIASYAKVIPNPSMKDIGVAMQFELYQQLKANGKCCAIVDAKDLLKAPRRVLSQLCKTLNLSFDPNMLHWEAGARPEDGCWAKYWYNNVHQSTGFQAYQNKKVYLPPELEQLATACTPFYEKLYAQALR